MDFDTFIAIACLIFTVVSYAVYRYYTENVYLTYKDQKVGGKKHGKT